MRHIIFLAVAFAALRICASPINQFTPRILIDIFPNATVVNLVQRIRLVSFHQNWKYHNQGVDLGQSWKHLNYDDSHCNSGPGLLGFETTTATLNTLSNQNLFVQTRLSRYAPANPLTITSSSAARFYTSWP